MCPRAGPLDSLPEVRPTLPEGISVKTCSFEGCERGPAVNKATGLCSGHQQQHYAGRALKPLRVRHTGQLCAYKGCKSLTAVKDLCKQHNHQRLTRGELSPIREYEGLAPNGQCRGCGRVKPQRTQLCDRCRRLRYCYKVDRAWVRHKLQEQDGCSGCHTTDSGGKDWCIDHDHACCPGSAKSCGACVRGVLCSLCNMALGSARDDAWVLRSLIRYKERYGDNTT